MAQTVFPPDARRLVTATTAPGWRTIAHLVMFDRAVAIEGECSGVFLNYNVILTAAHCVYNNGSYVGSVLVVPGETQFNPPFGYAAARRFSVPVGWSTGSGRFDPSLSRPPDPYDFALVYLDGAPFGSALAPYLTVADAPDSYFYRPDIIIATAGYPGDKPLGSMWTADSDEFFLDETYLYTRLDIYPGQSGSPIYTFSTLEHGGYIFSVVSGGSDSHNRSVRFKAIVISSLRSYCSSNGCSITTTTVQDAYRVSAYAFCKTSQSCANGPEPLVAGQMARVGFGISPNPTSQVRAEAYWNGTKYNEFTWPPAAGGTFYLFDPGLGFPVSAGTIELRIWVGTTYVGSISAAVAAAPATAALTPTPSPTATRTATPTAAPPTTTATPTSAPVRFKRFVPLVSSDR